MTQPAPTPHPYNGISKQRAAILARLTKSPATGMQLQIEHNVPDPTARIHELRNEGHQIETRWVYQVNPGGAVNRVGLYVLLVRDDRQGELDFPE